MPVATTPKGALMAAALCAAAGLLFTGCAADTDQQPAPPATAPVATEAGTAPAATEAPAPTPAATAPPTPEPAPAATPAPLQERETVAGLLDELAVAAEDGDGYDRDLFKHWVDADGDGCDTRKEVLIEEAVIAPTVGAGCSLSDGAWWSPYDNRTEQGTGRGFDIDHLVPLAEAWRSGASEWDPGRREEFANNLFIADALIAVSASSNRSKADRDPARWLPPNQASHCWYAATWIHVKSAYSLAVDPDEKAALAQVVAGCDSFAAPQIPSGLDADSAAQPARPPATTGPEAAPVPAATPAPDASAERRDPSCHPAYDPCLRITGDLNCGDLTASQKPVRVLTPGVDPYRLDRDGDGRGCES